MKNIIFTILTIFWSLVLIDNLASRKSHPIDNSIEIIENQWQIIDGENLKFTSVFSELHFSWSKFLTYSIYVDKRIKALDKNKTLPIQSFYEEGVDDNIPSLPSNNILSLNEATYFNSLSAISTSADEEGYYNKTIVLKFNESLPGTIKRIFTNHYIYFQTKTSQLIALKLDVLPYDSVPMIILFATCILGVFLYLMLNGINFILGILLGLLYASIFTALDFIPKSVLIFIIALSLPLFVTFKLKVWSVERKIFTSSFFILTILLFGLTVGYFYFINEDFKIYLEETAISSIILMLSFALLGLGFTVYSMIELYSIVRIMLFGKKFTISDFEIRSAHIKTYHRSLPDYFISLELNDEFVYMNAHCTRKIFQRYKQNKGVKLNVLYRNKRGDIVIL